MRMRGEALRPRGIRKGMLATMTSGAIRWIAAPSPGWLKSALLIILLSASLLACSHTPVRVDYVVTGRVVDAQSAAPLEGVRITVHWPKAMPADPRIPPSRQTFTDLNGHYLVFHPTLREGTVAVGFIPTSVDEGNAEGTALTASCPNCRSMSVGVGKGTMDFLTRDAAGKVVIAGSVARGDATIEARPDGTTVVEYELPDIPLELHEERGPPPIPNERAPAKPTPPEPQRTPPQTPSPDA
jgi:hypothetical protein